MKRIPISMLLFFIIVLLSFNLSYAQNIPSPEEFFGFKMGTEGELVHWNKVLEYFDLLSQRSDKVMLQDLGESTLGNRFILVVFSSPENLRNIEKYRRINKQLADPRGLS
ncbi:MAG: hypothetical protein GY863_09070, partial [bacterium]|nr:hypothetical protein [bacterium]